MLQIILTVNDWWWYCCLDCWLNC